MGMAASQARLLTITARLADNELKSQSINNAKMRLATQSSQASEKYINALNQANLMFSNYDASGSEQSQLLTFNALTAFSSYNNQYGLVNAAGQLLVSESEAKIFEAAGGNLNDYLQAHGLVYDTTYFEQLQDIDNKGIYPEPFNNISTDTLKTWYEAYGSLENSQEQEDYKKNYSDFTASTNTFKAGLKNAFKSFVNDSTKDVATPADQDNLVTFNRKLPKSNLFTPTTTYVKSFAGELLKDLENYPSKTSKLWGYLTHDAQEEITNIKNSAKINGNTLTISSDNNIGSIDAENNIITIKGYNWTYKYDEVLKTYSIASAPEKETKEDKDGNPGKDVTTFVSPTTSYKNLTDLINDIQIIGYEYDEKGNLTGTDTTRLNATKAKDGTYSITSYRNYDLKDMDAQTGTTNANNAKNAMNDLAARIYEILTDTNSINIDTIIKDYNKNIDTGIDFTKEYEGKTIAKLAEEYSKNKDAYLNFIFDKKSYDGVNALLVDGTITAKDLTDPDFVLKLAKEKGFVIASSYETIIEDMFVSKMIEETGEPKYAWIDENDTGKTGNADAKAQWYTNLFNRMKQGYKQLENGLASSSQWIEYALESGIVSMEQVDKNYTWKSLDYKTCTKITEETDNSAAVTKAEAEYNRAMNDINSKDSMYDIQLKNIDTEHSALQTEYDSIKNALTKNIDRTFKFSSNG
mgnify:CR=1 FL=1